ncbi:hypothetical protein OPV22_007778 [Ensete ventricosum]|uniref:RNase H type-1 domain-containing protein n=1 Tax=Ensete ventricosum TaxID=4639 RepID=A0AAV8RB84_ENSVE|nr:hypothetical protein OPV22_007778 [Ensete ventricosum]
MNTQDWAIVRKIKEQVSKLPDLEIPPVKAIMIIEADGCMEGWGGICKWKATSDQPRWAERICAYASGKFQPIKSTIDAEIQAVINSLDKFKIYYLDKRELIIRTDSAAIVAFYKKISDHKPSRIRWLQFTDYITGTGLDVKFEHIDGKDNVLADTLSRLVQILIQQKKHPVEALLIQGVEELARKHNDRAKESLDRSLRAVYRWVYEVNMITLIKEPRFKCGCDVCVVGVARTPMGSFLGALSSLAATKLGSIAIECALKRAGIDPSLVQEVFFGNVLSANLGQAPARQAALGAGIPNTVVCTTINKVCASGMKATMLAAQSIQLGINDVVVAGGMESMSNAPKYVAEARKGSRFGHDTLVDGMLKDGLWDVYNNYAMGMCAELCADHHLITREEQDDYAIQSNERGITAKTSGAFAWEIVPVEVSAGRGKPSVIIDKDESLEKFDPAKLRKLRPSFKDNGGTVTAGNASSISDGAAALVLVSGKKALELGLQVIARIRGYADAAHAPELFTTAPALAIPKAISNAGLEASQVDYYEINEAFSVVALANQKLLSLPSDKVNVHGGAVSMGHPLGCSGARILVTLLGVLRQRNGKIGVGGVCNGGGGASALEDKGRALPKFGEWDVNDPASSEGFTVIFNKARDERKTGGGGGNNARETDSPGKAGGGTAFKNGPYASKPNAKKWLCCMYAAPEA